MKYKCDRRNALDQSEYQSEEHKKDQNEKFSQVRTIMKYRLFGREGITEREFEKLVDWKYIPLKKWV